MYMNSESVVFHFDKEYCNLLNDCSSSFKKIDNGVKIKNSLHKSNFFRCFLYISFLIINCRGTKLLYDIDNIKSR